MAASKSLSVVVGVGVVAAASVAVYFATTMNYTGPCERPTDYMDRTPKTPLHLVRYREADRIETGLRPVRALAVGPKGKVYVAGDATIRVFDGEKHTDIRTASPAQCLAVADDGTLYAGMADHVEVFGSDGSLKVRWPAAGETAIFTSIAVAGDRVYVGDAGNRVILRYDRSGQLLGRIRKKDPKGQMDGVLMPSPHFDVTLRPGAADNLLRANDPGRLCVDVYTADGDPVASWGKPSLEIDGFGGCCNPTDIAVLPDGRVVTSEKGEARVKVYKADGTFDCVVAGPESFPQGWCSSADCTRGKALDLATDRNGRIFVLDPTTSTVRVFVPKGGPR